MPKEWKRKKHGRTLAYIRRPSVQPDVTRPGDVIPCLSTLLMTVIPAQVAGVKRIRVFSPNPAKATLAAAALLGVREFYRVGGAQAIAALAYGTETIEKVAK